MIRAFFDSSEEFQDWEKFEIRVQELCKGKNEVSCNIRGLINGLTGISGGLDIYRLQEGRRRVVFLVVTLVYVLCSIAILQVYNMVPGVWSV